MLAGVVAGSSLVATRLLTDQKLAAKNAETRDQVEQLHKLVYSTLQDKDNCTRTLFNGAFPSLTLNTLPQSVLSKTGSAVVEKFSVGSKRYMNNNVILNNISFAYTAGASTGTLRLEYQRQTNDAAGAKRLKEGYGAKDVAKNVMIRVQRDPLYKVGAVFTYPYTSCYAVVTDSDTGSANGEDGNSDLSKTMCEQLNSGDASSAGKSFFVWDEATSTCKPKENVCKNMGEVNTGINSNGEVECRRIQDWMDTGKLIDPTSVNPAVGCPASQYVKMDTAGGKIRIYCSATP